jgi:DNA-binding CsgD family transcriptional regulator
MIGTSASVLVEYDRAERWLGEGIGYAERVELWNHRHDMAAHLAHVRWARGDLAAAEDLAAHGLSAREFQVARLVAAGMTNRQIAERLVLSPKTIAAHVEHILTKLGAGRRAGIAAWAAGVTSRSSVG